MPVSPNIVGMAFMCVSSNEKGVALCASVLMKEAWPFMCKSLNKGGVAFKCINLNKEGCGLYVCQSK